MAVITLTTDFGLQDHYVGTMKGVLLNRCPGAVVVDICHELPPFSVWSGAYAIDQAAPFFPPGTFHVVVIDPGVGTERKPILMEVLGQYFIAPDNGVLSLIRRRESGPVTVREIVNRELFLPRTSATFHGRDLFAPAAATLAAGKASSEQAGPRLSEIEMLDGIAPTAGGPGCWIGRVLSVDRFGNVITNFDISLARDGFELETPGGPVNTLRQTFGGAPESVAFAYLGSSGYLEIGMNQRSAASFLQLAPGDSLTVRLR
jgi:S-adenosylmethionine hydrolase